MTILTLPTYLPVAEAARKYGMSVRRLRALINDGTIKAAMVMNNLVVDEDEVRDKFAQTLRKEDLPEYKKFAHLAGQSIWLSEASRLYNIPQQTISRWVQMGIIKKLEPSGNKVMIDQADMAYCAEIYHSRQTKQGRRLFEKNGLPYKPKTGPLSLGN
jgi:predicted site-specific integrase-resolvase